MRFTTILSKCSSSTYAMVSLVQDEKVRQMFLPEANSLKDSHTSAMSDARLTGAKRSFNLRDLICVYPSVVPLRSLFVPHCGI